MRIFMLIALCLCLSLCLVGCGEPDDVWELMEQKAKEEEKRLKKMSPEERQAYLEEKERQQEQERAEAEAERQARYEQLKWEEEHTDKIHYAITRHSSDGKWVDPDRYHLSPMPDGDTKLKRHKLKNRGYDSELDQSLIVNSSFLGGVPRGRHDVYAIVWKKDGRTKEDIIRVELAYKDISRVW